MKARTDEYLDLDVRDLQRGGALTRGKTVIRSWPSVPYVLHMRMGSESAIELRFVAAGVQRVQRVALTYTAPNYGGSRPWFLCGCSRRVAILYLAGASWRCRRCGDLDYQTQHEDRFMRAYGRKKAIYRRLGSPWPDDGRLQPSPPIPPKPFGMHTVKYWQLLARVSRANREMYEYIAPLAERFNEAMERADTPGR